MAAVETVERVATRQGEGRREIVHCQTDWCKRPLVRIVGPGEFEYRVPTFHRRNASYVTLHCPDCGSEREWRVWPGTPQARDVPRSDRFLANVSLRLFPTIPDAGAMLREAVSLPVPELADWSIMATVAPGELPSHIASHHRDQSLDHYLRLLLSYVHAVGPSDPLAAVLYRGESLIRHYQGELPDPSSVDPDYRRLVSLLLPCSTVAAPLQAHGRIYGAILLGRDRDYRPDDLPTVEGYAHRVALGLEACGRCRCARPRPRLRPLATRRR